MSAEFIRVYESVMQELLIGDNQGDGNKISLDAPSNIFSVALLRGLQKLRDNKPVGEHVKDMLNSVKNACDTPGISEAIDAFMSNDVSKPPNDKANQGIADYMESIHEACCDIFMIQCAQMSAEQYLDFVCDYMYTTMKPVKVSHEDLPESFTLRLGMAVDYYGFRGGNTEWDVNEGDEKCDRIIVNWEEYNKAMRDKRQEEGRDISRVDFRLNMAECIKEALRKYRATTVNRRLLHRLLRIGIFKEISENLFREQTGEARKALQAENYRFIANAQLIMNISREYTRIQNKYDNTKIKREREIMKLVLKIVQHFSGQTRSWSDIWNESQQCKEGYCDRNECIIPDEVRSCETVTYRRNEHERIIYRYDDFFRLLDSVTDELQPGKKQKTGEKPQNNREILWYRGVERQSYSLVPSIYREYKAETNEIKLNGDSGRLQSVWLNEYTARATSSGDIDLAQVASTADWLAVMQHYNAKTHFLDWSEQLFGAMYFLLEPIILSKYDNNEDVKLRAEKTREEGAALYILAPYMLNRAWMKNVSSYKNDTVIQRIRGKCLPIKHILASKFNGVIPNISREDAADTFATHLLGCDECTQCRKAKACQAQLPLAVQTNRSNKRIAAQTGTFVAFSANAHDFPGNYDLLKIQEKWLTDGICDKPFIYKLVIHKSAMDELANWLVTAGMMRFRFYPDLEYIGKDIPQHLKAGEK